MVKCPFCHFDNEDGALFCEQCKSDLGVVEPASAAAVHSASIDTIPLAAIEEVPVAATPVMEAVVAEMVHETIPLAGVVGTEETMTGVPLAEVTPIVTPDVAPVAASIAETPAAGAAPTTPTTDTTAPAAAVAEPAPLPPSAQPRLRVMRGQKRNVEYPIYEGHNFIGRADEKPVDIDLEDQEPQDRVLCSRQHALITFADNKLVIEDLNSSNYTYVNRVRIYPGQKRALGVDDLIQIGNVQLKVIV